MWPALRLLRASLLLFRIFASYIVQICLSKIFGYQRLRARWQRVHRRNAKRLYRGILRLRGVYIKMGQVLSIMGTFLPRAYGEELEGLQDQVPPHSWKEVERTFFTDFGRLPREAFTSFEEKPLAAASLGQVHRARLPDGTDVAVKILYPNVDVIIKIDLRVLRWGMSLYGWFVPMRSLQRVIDQLQDLLQRETNYVHEARCCERMAKNFEGQPDVLFPLIHWPLTSERVLTMTFMPGIKISRKEELVAQGIEPYAVATRLVQVFYQQLFLDRFFHADPHPGNLMWCDGRVYFLDFGMVGEVGPELREGLVLLLLAFWQEDEAFLAETLLLISGDEPHPDLDLRAFQEDLGLLVARYRHLPLRDLQLGPMLQDMSTLAIRYEVPLPATMILTAKALAQIQHATVQLDPDIDPFAVAGRYLARSTMQRVTGVMRPQQVLYEGQKIRVRIQRLIEAFERLVGARPGANLQVQFRGIEGLETNIRRASRRIAVALAALGAFIGTAMTADSTHVASWVAPVFGGVAAVLTGGLVFDVSRRGR